MANVTTAPTRLLIVNPSPVRGGAEEALLDFVTRCDPAVVRPLVACLARGPFVADLEAAGVAVRVVPAGRLRYPWAWARAVARLAVLARSADAVLSWQVKGHYYGTPAARLAHVPAGWWDHGIRPAPGETRYAIDNRLPALLRADLVVCSSTAAAARHPGSVVVHPGVDLEAYRHVQRARARRLLEIGEREQAIGIVGRLQPWKGQHIFLRAAARLKDRFPFARFWVIGDAVGGFSAGYPAELRALVRSLGLEDRVSFLGHRDDVATLLGGLDVFVLASFDEPFGIVNIEAMAAGVPVVATRAGGVPEIVTHETDGLLVPPGDDAAIADAVARLLDDPAFAASIASAGRLRAFSAFGLDRYVAAVTDVVQTLARK